MCVCVRVNETMNVIALLLFFFSFSFSSSLFLPEKKKEKKEKRRLFPFLQSKLPTTHNYMYFSPTRSVSRCQPAGEAGANRAWSRKERVSRANLARALRTFIDGWCFAALRVLKTALIPSSLLPLLTAVTRELGEVNGSAGCLSSAVSLEPAPALGGGLVARTYGQSVTGHSGMYGQSVTGHSGTYGQSVTGHSGTYGQSVTGHSGTYGQPVTGHSGTYGQPVTGHSGTYGQPVTGHGGTYVRAVYDRTQWYVRAACDRTRWYVRTGSL